MVTSRVSATPSQVVFQLPKSVVKSAYGTDASTMAPNSGPALRYDALMTLSAATDSSRVRLGVATADSPAGARRTTPAGVKRPKAVYTSAGSGPAAEVLKFASRVGAHGCVRYAASRAASVTSVVPSQLVAEVDDTSAAETAAVPEHRAFRCRRTNESAPVAEAASITDDRGAAASICPETGYTDDGTTMASTYGKPDKRR
mmetsp:Transcript_15003/g.38544  ORF Transcript_15003/g.38544 Transcript_15003/m.38544 type:complete len:201 (-) Transcript_15003:547-1149(-)